MCNSYNRPDLHNLIIRSDYPFVHPLVTVILSQELASFCSTEWPLYANDSPSTPLSPTNPLPHELPVEGKAGRKHRREGARASLWLLVR